MCIRPVLKTGPQLAPNGATIPSIRSIRGRSLSSPGFDGALILCIILSANMDPLKKDNTFEVKF